MHSSLSAAERRKIIATAEGRGFMLNVYEPRSGDRVFRRYAAYMLRISPSTAFSRGYILPPLRGCAVR
jgi:hypothetical protein